MFYIGHSEGVGMITNYIYSTQLLWLVVKERKHTVDDIYHTVVLGTFFFLKKKELRRITNNNKADVFFFRLQVQYSFVRYSFYLFG